jgi:iron complex outermembrane receptor protein
MSSRHRITLALVCAAPFCRGQTVTPAPTPPAHVHTPHTSAHAGGVVVLDQFVASATPFGRNQADLAQSTTVLSGQSLLLKQQATVGETLGSETGIQATAFGPGASRPIIRGLSGDRIRLLENSIGTNDASVISPDHAVSVEPFLIERIEVVRGPASLLYGSNAVGGVVNVITHRIETDLPTEPVRGSAEFRGGTASSEVAAGGVVDFSLKTAPDRAFVAHLDAFRRSTENLRIPDFAESARIRAEETEHADEHGEPVPHFARRRLPNSALDSRSGAIGVSYVTPTFHFGASHSGFESNYGVPGHAHDVASDADTAEGVRIDLRQRRTDLQGEWHGDAGFIQGARFKFGHADYRHGEIEPDGTVGTVFTNQGHEGRVELLHGGAKPWVGAVGVQVTRSDFGAVGDEAFLPSSVTDSAALFAFEEVTAGPVTWQFGARYERTKIAPATVPARRDNELATSLGVIWKFDDTHAFALSVADTGRAPNVQELYAYGAHAGTRSFEIGDPALGSERSLGLEASLRRRKGFVTGALTVFAHRFRGYIFEQPTGLVALEEEGAWHFLSSDSDDAEAREDGLPLYRYVRSDARFWGAELETIWHVHESSKWDLDLRLAADLTRAREGARNLPRIPAPRTTAGISWSGGAWTAGAECQVVFDQKRVAAGETTSSGYTLLSAHVSRSIELGHAELQLFVRGSNLLNDEARPHPSFVKELAPLAGRGAVAGVRLSF